MKTIRLSLILAVCVLPQGVSFGAPIKVSSTDVTVGSPVTVSYDARGGVIWWQQAPLGIQAPVQGDTQIRIINPSGVWVSDIWVDSRVLNGMDPIPALIAWSGVGTVILDEVGTWTFALYKSMWLDDGNWNPVAVDHSVTVRVAGAQPALSISIIPGAGVRKVTDKIFVASAQ